MIGTLEVDRYMNTKRITDLKEPEVSCVAKNTYVLNKKASLPICFSRMVPCNSTISQYRQCVHECAFYTTMPPSYVGQLLFITFFHPYKHKSEEK